MKPAPSVVRDGRHALFRLAAILLLVAEVVAIGLTAMAEGRESQDFPTHIEGTGAPPHAGHHPGICAFCVHRDLSALPLRRSAAATHVAPPPTLRPAMQVTVSIARYDRPDPARAPPSPEAAE